MYNIRHGVSIGSDIMKSSDVRLLEAEQGEITAYRTSPMGKKRMRSSVLGPGCVLEVKDKGTPRGERLQTTFPILALGFTTHPSPPVAC